jgi:hypothetical protein
MTQEELNQVAAEIYGLQTGNQHYKGVFWNPCENREQAFLVLDKFQFYNTGRQDKDDPFYCEIYSEKFFEDHQYDGTAYEKSLPLAITKAAVAAWIKSRGN